MLIDTHTISALEMSILEYFNLQKGALLFLLDKIYRDESGSIEYPIKQFVGATTYYDTIEKIQFFHLSRRLKSDESKEIVNLPKMLLEESPLSLFLKKNNISFKNEDEHIALFYKGKKVDLMKDNGKGNVEYLRWRLGYFENEKDYCVNGFAFRNNLEKNLYYDSLRMCPEIISNIASYLGLNSLPYNYMDESVYYCYEFHVPIESVILDGYDENLSIEEKRKLFLEKAIKRLYDNWIYSNGCDNENLIVRLPDNDNMPSKYYVNREII